jgi:hypothetical protein
MTPRLVTALCASAFATLSVTAGAKLPPPTTEEIAAEQQKRAASEAQLQREKALLEQAQDRVSERYRRERGSEPSAGAGGRVSDTNMPKTAKELPGTGTPEGGRKQSAEAHSAPAK